MIRTKHSRFDKEMIIIHPGEFFVSNEDIVIGTVLGSCVAVVLYDQGSGLAGMNHFMLPGAFTSINSIIEDSGRYGVFAMEVLINDMLKKGARRDHLQAKVFGGGHVISTDENGTAELAPEVVRITELTQHKAHIHRPAIANPTGQTQTIQGAGTTGHSLRRHSIPESNITFALTFLENEGIPIVSQDTGGLAGRKVFLIVESFRVMLKRFWGSQAGEAAVKEIEYYQRLQKKQRAPSNTTLF